MKLPSKLKLFIKLVTAVSLFVWIPVASSTSYVAAYGDHRIILAADGKATYAKGSPEKICKIIILGKYGFAASGTTEYRGNSGDALKPWNAAADAKTAYTRNPQNLDAMAAEWANLQEDRFQEFYKAHPDRVVKIGGPGGFLVGGTFVGFDSHGDAYAFTEIISYDKQAKTPITLARNVTPLKQRAYCNDPITEELFEDNTGRAHSYDMKWQQLQRSTPRAEFDWRYTQFLIKSTADFEDNVGREVDILAITPSAGPVWLQKNACRSEKH